MWHHQRRENTVFTGCFTDILQRQLIGITTISTANATHISVKTIFIPTQKIHPNEVNTKVMIVFEEAIYIGFGSRTRSNYPRKPAICCVLMKHLVARTITKIADGNIFCAPDMNRIVAMNP